MAKAPGGLHDPVSVPAPPRLAAAAGVALLLLTAARGGLAQPGEPGPRATGTACSDEECVAAAARALLEEGDAAAAVDLLEDRLDAFPDSGPIQVLLGAAYLQDDRPLWAVDTLGRRLEQDPSDCEAAAWLARAHLQLGIVVDSHEVPALEECVGAGPAGTRILMLRALAAHYGGEEDEALAALALARDQDEAYPADRPALTTVTRMIDPGRLDDVSWKVDVGAGYTSNALLGSPSDPASSDIDPGSVAFTLDGWFRAAPDLGSVVRPLVELGPRVAGFAFEDVRDQSYMDLTGRVGVYLDWGMPRLLVAYRPDYLLLFDHPEAGGAVWYYAAHRGEVEAEVTPWLLVFAGAGRRDFWDMGRSRVEMDGGFGGRLEMEENLAFLWSVTGRGHVAQNPAYDLGGGTLLLHMQYRLRDGWTSRAGVTLAADWYPDSAGSFSTEDGRRDLFLKAGYALWTPPLAGVRLGLTYDYSIRDSTAPDYGFYDHRVLLRAGWSGSLDATLPSESSVPALAEMDWNLAGGDAVLEERIQDLLREDQQLSRSCGCAE